LHLDLDGAWSSAELPIETIDAMKWGPQLRFSAPPRLIEKFYSEFQSRLAPFLLFGSGDFHHLTALWVRRISQPVVVISFDNHPDWDVRPPQWCCGGWVNRALELRHVERVSVWGCGNFECWWPHQIWGNRRAEREGKLEVHPWADDRPEKDRQRRGAILRENWREHFERFVNNLRGARIYVTIDLDCLNRDQAVSNWESGRFGVVDLLWALERLRAAAQIVAGDICGAFSPPAYARWKQRFASEMDHPKLNQPDLTATGKINAAAFAALWPALTQ
jgi:arginase family enzyme